MGDDIQEQGREVLMPDNGNIDPNAGLQRIIITYNPVNKQVELKAEGVGDDVQLHGILELGRLALISRSIQNLLGARQQIAVPGPRIVG